MRTNYIISRALLSFASRLRAAQEIGSHRFQIAKGVFALGNFPPSISIDFALHDSLQSLLETITLLVHYDVVLCVCGLSATPFLGC